VCDGGGPGGLYLAVTAKLRDRGHEVTVVERNPRGVTYGWGVVFWDDLLETLYRNDPRSAREIYRSAVVWNGQQVRVQGDRTAHVGGYGYGTGRAQLLDILTRRAEELGVDLQFGRELDDLAEVRHADLVVACDGANSRVRRRGAEAFRPVVDVGRNVYVWLGTSKVFDAFTFAFERTEAGWIWFHAYAYDDRTSTCIVECAPETWKGLGLDSLGPEDSLALLEGVFARHLDGHGLRARNSPPDRSGDGARTDELTWLSFTQVSNGRWASGNVVLLGDAAHTTHFSIGSGTRLAIEDAVALADKLDQHEDLTGALAAYEQERGDVVRAWQDEAQASALWFENAEQHVQQRPVPFAYSLLTRRSVPGQQDGAESRPARWRFRLHLATQNRALRALRRAAVTGPRQRRRVARRERLYGDAT